MLTKNAAAECAELGIRVNAVCPAAVNTPMNDTYFESVGGHDSASEWMRTFQPLVPILEPDDIANAAIFLASDDSRAMTGASMVVDGGLLANWDHVSD
jgi:dihydroanticapsin dehydrogenase